MTNNNIPSTYNFRFICMKKYLLEEINGFKSFERMNM